VKLYVVSHEPDPPAARALRMEGLEPRLLDTAADYAYGDWFSQLWDAGEPFITVEHDIVPWPGAVDALDACPEPWCTHRFPNGSNLMISFGIGKYTPTGRAPDSWSGVRDGRMLDGEVLPYLLKTLGLKPHVHDPPVAHARAVTEGALAR